MKMIGFGGSCHWCTEAIFQSVKGVQKVEQGWISSKEYPAISEAVVVQYDPSMISLDVLIEIHLHSHSCTSSHAMREKYRSAVYTYDKHQSKAVDKVIQTVQVQFENPIITRALTFDSFIINKEQYLDYYYKNPEKPFCKTQINPKLRKILSMFTDRVDSSKLKL